MPNYKVFILSPIDEYNSQGYFSLKQKEIITEKLNENAELWGSVPNGPSTTQLLHLRFRDHCRRRDRKSTKARGRAFSDLCCPIFWDRLFHDLEVLCSCWGWVINESPGSSWLCPLPQCQGVQAGSVMPRFWHRFWGFELRSLCLHSKYSYPLSYFSSG